MTDLEYALLRDLAGLAAIVYFTVAILALWLSTHWGPQASTLARAQRRRRLERLRPTIQPGERAESVPARMARLYHEDDAR
jgi:hypothetical protein